MHKYKILFLAALVLLLTAPVYSQTAVKLEALMNEKAVTWTQAAAFVLEAADIEAANAEDAFKLAAERKWLPANAKADGKASLNGTALLLMKAFDIKGGIFYSISKSPHHAYRELVYKEVIRGTDPDANVSGPELLLMIGRILSGIEARQAVEL